MALHRNLTLSLVLCIVAGYVGYGLSSDCAVGALCNGTATCPQSVDMGNGTYCLSATSQAPCAGCSSTGNLTGTCWMPSGSGPLMTCTGYISNGRKPCSYSVEGCVTDPCP